MIGLLGKKLGMTHIYDDYGRRLAVTAVQAGPCTVVRLREPAKDGYAAVQVGFEPVAAANINKPQQGQWAKAGCGPFRYVREFRHEGVPELQAGQQLTVELFQSYELVDVTGVSIGKGFQGGVRRWGWRGGGATHGSMSHRAPGSIGSTTTPGRVIRGHHLPGHMGHVRVTVQNVRLAKVDAAHHLLLIEGAVPGPEGELVFICRSKKRPSVIKRPLAFQEIVEEDETLSKTAKAASKKLKTAAK